MDECHFGAVEIIQQQPRQVDVAFLAGNDSGVAPSSSARSTSAPLSSNSRAASTSVFAGVVQNRSTLFVNQFTLAP